MGGAFMVDTVVMARRKDIPAYVKSSRIEPVVLS